jgi:GNAT superfamily N-acetyltransferase
MGTVAWVAMLLVDTAHRRQGIGKALLCRALDFTAQQGASSVRLDATPLGEPLYVKLGFRAEYSLHRYEGTLLAGPPVAAVEALVPPEIPDMLYLDREVTQTDRHKLLSRMADEFPGTLRVVCGATGLQGYRAARPGARALYLGPCIARGTAGRALLEDARHQHGGREVFIDILDHNLAAVAWAQEAGLTRQRRLLRMCRGPRLTERIEGLWASSGPETG